MAGQRHAYVAATLARWPICLGRAPPYGFASRRVGSSATSRILRAAAFLHRAAGANHGGVFAAARRPWSTRLVEGHVNRLELAERSSRVRPLADSRTPGRLTHGATPLGRTVMVHQECRRSHSEPAMTAGSDWQSRMAADGEGSRPSTKSSVDQRPMEPSRPLSSGGDVIYAEGVTRRYRWPIAVEIWDGNL